MYIIVGLGNPGEKYVHTRHNVGFEVIDILADRIGIHVDEKKHKGLCGRGVLEGQKVVLVKPQTFMNLSGESVRAVADFYKVAADEIIVVYDDISLEPGRLRVRGKGSAGGHNGIKNIIAHLGTQDFPRIKIGTGAPEEKEGMIDWVIGVPSQKEREQLLDAFHRAIEAAACVIEHGCQRAMNDFN